MDEGVGNGMNAPQRLSVFVYMAIGAFLIWIVYWTAVVWLIPESDVASAERGQFGDMFGAVNALFSALAFAGIIYTILLQRKELSLQRYELELTRNELSRTAEGQALKEAYDYARSTHMDRRRVFGRRDYVHSVDSTEKIDTMLKNEGKLFDSVREASNCYHYIGFLVSNQILTKKKALFEEGGETMLQFWEVVEPLIKAERIRTNRLTYKKYFEALVDEYRLWTQTKSPGGPAR